MPWKQHSVSDWEREKHQLQMKLLQTNSALRLKTLYAERLEHLVCERNKRIDTLYSQLQSAWQRNRKLEAEAEHLAALVANRGQPPLAVGQDAA